MKHEIWNQNCITGAKNITNDSINLVICDPPFGLNESTFQKHYNRKDNTLQGYVEAPDDYDKFTLDWMTEAHRILKENGTMYIVSGWTNLSSFYKAIEKLGLIEINHLIWKYNFGVNTSKKYVSSHYHIFYLGKSDKRTFNTNCRFNQIDKTNDNKSMLYQDLEDVWIINKEYQPGEIKNVNKLPNKLVEKMIQYSSNYGDTVCDFFMGNFTTANCALRLGRKVKGFEMNPDSYNHFIKTLDEIKFGCDYNETKIDNTYFNQGKPLTEEETKNISNKFKILIKDKSKKDAIDDLTKEFGRGRFSISNILKKQI
jgi:site-specific DNA-methyltransferase (adenine-specific)